MRDRPGAIRAIDDALAASVVVDRPVAAAPAGIPAPQVPRVSYSILPGHWQLDGARYVWVPLEARPRRVEDRAFALGHYVWRGGEWSWMPGHFRVE
jgi:WXXGXW repeat (2 copies)